MTTSAHSNKIFIYGLWGFVSLSFVIAALLSGCGTGGNPDACEIAVSNSYLDAAVSDLCGPDENIFSLVPPGMCPGHFDIKPSEVQRLTNCRVLFLFDFQKNIENAVPRIKQSGLVVFAVEPGQGLCLPDTYLDVVRQVADALIEIYPSRKDSYLLRLEQIRQRMQSLSAAISLRMHQSGLTGSAVLTSGHQQVFASWLGLDTVSVFSGSDTATPANINENLNAARQRPVRFVIANRQEGTGLAGAVGEHLDVPVVVFSNFPSAADTDGSSPAFDNLVEGNMNALLEAVE